MYHMDTLFTSTPVLIPSLPLLSVNEVQATVCITNNHNLANLIQTHTITPHLHQSIVIKVPKECPYMSPSSPSYSSHMPRTSQPSL